MLRKLFVNMKKGTEFLNYGRDIIANWGAEHAASVYRTEGRPARVLDVGCGHGTDLYLLRDRAISLLEKNAGKSANANADADDGQTGVVALEGVENYPPYVEELKESGVVVHELDIERNRFPGDGGTYDIVIANQVLEHTKEIFWITSEVSRILRPGGLFIVGVPNLASLHNRLLLLFGQQPTAIQLLSAHVRGFTVPDFRRFAREGGFFLEKGVRGSNFYPFPPFISRPLARVFPRMAWGIFFRLQRTEKHGRYIDYLHENELETPFYGGPFYPER